MITNYALTVTGDLELPAMLESMGYYYKNNRVSYSVKPYSDTADLTFECDLAKQTMSGTVSTRISFIRTVTLPAKP